MKLLMLPHYKEVGLDNGVGQVLYHYHKYLPQVGIELTTNPDDGFDLFASHLGHNLLNDDESIKYADIFFSHGFWWGNNISDKKREQNDSLTKCAVNAKAVVVPSNFVAATFKRDFRLQPYVIPHGIEYQAWQHNYKSEGFILWNKNRVSDVCDPNPIYELAVRMNKYDYVTTFIPQDEQPIPNLKVTGRLPFKQMKTVIQKSGIYLATTKETFCIGALEALASGIPVLAFNWGGVADIITHKQDGYLVSPYDYDALEEGLEWLMKNRKTLKSNCIEKAKQYSWLNVAEQIKGVCKRVLEWKLNN